MTFIQYIPGKLDINNLIDNSNYNYTIKMLLIAFNYKQAPTQDNVPEDVRRNRLLDFIEIVHHLSVGTVTHQRAIPTLVVRVFNSSAPINVHQLVLAANVTLNVRSRKFRSDQIKRFC